MDFVTPISDIFNRLWTCVAKNVNTIRGLKAKVKALDSALVQLKNIKDDVARRVQLAEERPMERTKQVDGWLKRVESLEIEAKDISEKAEQELQRNCWSCSPNSCWSRYKLGDKAKDKLKLIDDLKDEGKFDVVADLKPRGPVDERPLEDSIGLNLTFEEVRGWIMDTQVKKIGIHGMGGVGKTTLLKMLNNDFAKRSHGFDTVIWVVVSKESNVDKIQEAICEQLKLSEQTWKNKSEDRKSVETFHALQMKKFVIMLDDLWERLDLTKVGIPTSDNHSMSKIIFTTRYEDVCGRMGADKMIKVKCLEKEEALILFKKNVGMHTLNAHPSLPKLAESLTEECKGLPLVVVVVGRAMTNKCNPRDWDRALEKLRKNPSEIIGMDDEVFGILRFSYDNLRNDITKSCFIYCSIYPEDYEIRIGDLLDLWIGDGFLDDFDDIHEARDRGLEIVEDLKAANLLEKGRLEKFVKMHDVIRDMALWISRGCEGKINKYMVLDRVELLEGQSTISRMTAEKISLWGGDNFSGIPDNQSWPNVSTFIMRDTKVKMFPSVLVQFMPNIKVLDLSWNGYIETLPFGIGGLTELEFLNTSFTLVRELPIDLAKLTKLKYLLLGNILHEGLVIPPKLISSFCFLRVFRLMGIDSASNNDEEDNILSGGSSKLLEELESLQHLSDVSIGLYDAPSVNKLRHSSKLQNCMRELELWKLDDLEISSSLVKGLRNLEILYISMCTVEQLIINCEPNHDAYFNCLREVDIFDCKSLVQLTWLIAYAPALELLRVLGCRSMIQIVEVVPDHVGVEPHFSIFSRLKLIVLRGMPSLCTICPTPLPFPSLLEIYVNECPNLRRLPFDSSSGNGTLKKIGGEREWWDQLQWDDQTYEPLFRPYFYSVHFTS